MIGIRKIGINTHIFGAGGVKDPFIQYLNASGETIDESNKGYSSVQIDYAISIFATCTNCTIDISGTNDHRTAASNDDLNTLLAAGNTITLNDVLGAELHTDLNAANDSATEAITAFADHAATIDGTTKVTIGQDITDMIPQGAEAVTNGDFSAGTGTNADNWTEGSGWTRVDTGGGVWVMRSTATTAQCTQALLPTPGIYYTITYTILNYVGGSVRVELGTVNGASRSANGTYTQILRAIGGSTVNFDGLTPFSGDIDNVSVKELEVLGADLVTDGDFGDVTLAAAKGVAGITKAAPGVVTFDAAHGYADGDVIYFAGLTEMTELNTEYWVLRGNAGDTFELQTTVGNSLDTSGYGAAETTGGAVAQHTTLTSWTEGTGWNPGVDGAGALSGTANCDGSQTGQSKLYQPASFDDGDVSLYKFTISNYSAGNIQIIYGSGLATGWISGDDTYSILINNVGAYDQITLNTDSSFAGSIDNVSIHKLLVTKEIAASTNYTGDHYVLPVDVNNLAIPVDYTAEAIVAQKITGETNATTGWTQVGLDAGVALNVSTCINHPNPTYAYTTFGSATPTGFDAISDGSAAKAAGSADEINIVSGRKYLVTFDAVLNSGIAPLFGLVGGILGAHITDEGGQLTTAGSNTFKFTANASTTGMLQFSNSNANLANFEITNLSVTTGNVFESQDTTVNDGVFALHADSNDTPSSTCRFYKDIETDMSISNGDVVRLSVDSRHIGTGANWRLYLAASTSGTNYAVKTIATADSTYETTVYYWTHDANHKYMLARIASGVFTGGVYVDAISIRKVTLT